MPQQEESQEIKDLRRQMRDGRTPLLEAIRETYSPYLLARKAYNRKHEEVREQIGLLNNTFSASIKKLRESSRNTEDSGEGMIALYETLSKQAKAVASFIDKELPGLRKLFEPVGEKYAVYQQAISDYHAFMARWQGVLPAGDLSGRALELVQQDIEKSLR